MRKWLFLFISAILFLSCGGAGDNAKKEDTAADSANNDEKVAVTKPVMLDEISFRQKVYDYVADKDLKFLGNKPCLIDFYADWCGPCRRLAPILEEIAGDYTGKINVYKVNIDDNPKVATYFQITNIPAVLLCPMQGRPQIMVGLYPKAEYINAMNQVLFKPAASAN